CDQPLIRREIRELSLDERKKFFAAVTKLHEMRPINGKNLNRLDYFAWSHDKIYDTIHMNPNFLPWHRYFLQLFQEMIWQVDPSVVVPYWDWTKDSQEPHKSPIFTDEFIGGNGKKQYGYELQNGFMANWEVNYPNTHKIKRCFRKNVNNTLVVSEEIDPWPSPILMNSLMNTNKDYSSFARDAELYHGYVHVSTGGEGAEMGKNYSPHDILFFLHHGYVDRYWWIWQKRNPDLARTYNGNHHDPPRQVSENDLLNFPGAPSIQVKDTFDTVGSRFCYVY
ncbi:Di-copper centre-containing protein, partial [Conidiobolus coronatus NRRL 28638]